VVVPPTYAEARSFSGGFAAVRDDDGLWGFINRDFALVIDHMFVDVHYFNSDETCFVSREEGTFQLLRFMF
jgi:hypothetical protein